MRITLAIGTAILMSGCTIERIGPPGVVMTRPIRVQAKDVQVFDTTAEVRGRFKVVDSIYVKDDGRVAPRVLERQLRELAGARGANAIITDPLNRKPNGTRVDFRPTLDGPFEYFSATAIWIGDGERPEKHLGTLGGGGWPVIRGLIVSACVLALAGCAVAPASERSLALVRPMPVHAGKISIYSNLCDVQGQIEVVKVLEVANAGRKSPAIEHELAVLAGRLGADAIVVHPFNRRGFGAAYTNSGADSFNPLRYSRATAVRVFADRPQVGEPGICSAG